LEHKREKDKFRRDESKLGAQAPIAI